MGVESGTDVGLGNSLLGRRALSGVWGKNDEGEVAGVARCAGALLLSRARGSGISYRLAQGGVSDGLRLAL